MKRNWRSNYEKMLKRLPANQWFAVKFTLDPSPAQDLSSGAGAVRQRPNKLLTGATARLLEALALKQGFEVRRSDIVLFVGDFGEGPISPIPDIEVEPVPVIDLDKRPSEQEWMK
jgi:hypothetical protein